MANKQDFSGSCMDGVRVKISEKFKPPPRIGLAMSYAQRLSLNKQLQDTVPKYEFVLEKTVVEKLKEWRTARAVMLQELKNRVEKAKKEHARQVEEAGEESEEKMFKPLYGPSQFKQSQSSILMPTQLNTYSNILTPIPLQDQALSQNTKTLEKSPFNISDFEADTSSPFDNMELKSINDLEELAQVLKRDKQESNPHSSYTANSFPTYTIPTTSHYIHSGSSSVYTNGYYYPPETINAFKTQYNFANVNYNTGQDSSVSAYNSVPNIIRSLQSELSNTHIDNTKSAEPLRSKQVETVQKFKAKNEDSIEDFNVLPKNLQDLSRTISMMGFPLSRVARVCKLLGNDQKKIVDHLLAMSDLLDLGFPENKVSSALLQCNNDREKALEILIP